MWITFESNFNIIQQLYRNTTCFVCILPVLLFLWFLIDWLIDNTRILIESSGALKAASQTKYRYEADVYADVNQRTCYFCTASQTYFHQILSP